MNSERTGLISGIVRDTSTQKLVFGVLLAFCMFSFVRTAFKTASPAVPSRAFSSLKQPMDIELLLAAFRELEKKPFTGQNYGQVVSIQAHPFSYSVIVSFSHPAATVVMRFSDNLMFTEFSEITRSAVEEAADIQQKERSMNLLRPVLGLTQADVLGDVQMAADFIAEKSNFFGIEGKENILNFKTGFLQGEPPLYLVPYQFQVDLENGCVIYDYDSQIKGKEGRGTDFAWVDERTYLVERIQAVRHGVSLSTLTKGETKPQ